jgi:hypothetical protein
MLDRPSNGAAILVHLQHPLYSFAVFLIRSKVEGSLYALHYEYFTLSFYLPSGVGVEAILIEGDLTRRQRAGKSAEQSAAGSSNQVIEGAGMRLLCVRGDAVVLGHFVVSPKITGSFSAGKWTRRVFPSTCSTSPREM